eukprot:Protomagalhaensia_wolfi_Nauph_80__2673@NODE_2804_length_982_cov_30_162248_g2201_i0_p1_GENE_NODE_2804_length_982_cov_30_162248_g2201_i0NODE_2804_length_982_cov_30_162248_g2201_i0_p1_ORF_typecomplete_len104_score4_25_NODE_2804_length_982_cov_30_162248_g2201_i0323634
MSAALREVSLRPEAECQAFKKTPSGQTDNGQSVYVDDAGDFGDINPGAFGTNTLCQRRPVYCLPNCFESVANVVTAVYVVSPASQRRILSGLWSVLLRHSKAH